MPGQDKAGSRTRPRHPSAARSRTASTDGAAPGISTGRVGRLRWRWVWWPAAPAAKDDPRLVAFATTLARARFLVLVPDVAGLRQLRVRAADAREIADA